MVPLMLFSIAFSDFSLCCWCFAKIGSAALQEEIDHTVQTSKFVAFAQGENAFLGNLELQEGFELSLSFSYYY